MRLTTNTKNQIQSAILAAKFGPAKDKLVKLNNELADRIYWSLPDIQLVAKCPPGFFQLRDGIDCAFGTYCDRLYFTERRDVPTKYIQRQSFDKDHDFSKQWLQLIDVGCTINDNFNALKSELQKIFASVNTDCQLLTIWPEASEWLAVTVKPTQTLPQVLSADKLKSLLGNIKPNVEAL